MLTLLHVFLYLCPCFHMFPAQQPFEGPGGEKEEASDGLQVRSHTRRTKAISGYRKNVSLKAEC